MRSSSMTFAVMMISSITTPAITVIYTSRIEPLKVLLVFNRNVAIFNDNHEDILDDWNQEEEEKVHEKDGIEEACMTHCGIGIVQGITSLQGKDCKEARCSSAEGFLKLPKDSNRKEANPNVDGKNSNPNFSDKRNRLMEGAHYDIEAFSVAKILCYRGPSAEGSTPNEYLTILQNKLVTEKEGDWTEDCAKIPHHWHDVPELE